MDETLYEERSYILSGFQVIAAYLSKKYGISKKKLFNALMLSFKTEGRGKNFDRILERFKLKKEDIFHLVQIYRNHKPKIKLLDGVKSLLKKLRSNYKIGIVTDGNYIMQKNKVEALNLQKYVDFIIYTDREGLKAKPDTSSFTKALEIAKSKANETVYIGDNPHKDFIGARRIGIKTIRINRGEYKNIEAGECFEADYVVSALEDVLPIICSQITS